MHVAQPGPRNHINHVTTGGDVPMMGSTMVYTEATGMMDDAVGVVEHADENENC